MFGKSIPLRWQLDARVDITRATCLEGVHQGPGVPAISSDIAVLFKVDSKNMGGAGGDLIRT